MQQNSQQQGGYPNPKYNKPYHQRPRQQNNYSDHRNHQNSIANVQQGQQYIAPPAPSSAVLQQSFVAPPQYVYLPAMPAMGPPPGYGPCPPQYASTPNTQQYATITYAQAATVPQNQHFAGQNATYNPLATPPMNTSHQQGHNPEKKRLKITDPSSGDVLNKEHVLPPQSDPEEHESESERRRNDFKRQMTERLQAGDHRQTTEMRENHPTSVPPLPDLDESGTSTPTSTVQTSEINADSEDAKPTIPAVVDQNKEEAIDEAKLSGLRDKILELSLQKDENNNPSEKIYGGEFMSVMHEYIKGVAYECAHVDTLYKLELHCSFAKFKHHSPGHSTSPKSERPKKFDSSDTAATFKPDWQTKRPQDAAGHGVSSASRFHTSRAQYAGRNSDSSHRNFKPSQQTLYGGRNSFERKRQYNRPSSPFTGRQISQTDSQSTLVATDSNVSIAAAAPEAVPEAPSQKKAWKPLRRALEGASEEEQKHEKLKMQIRGILNKITPSTFDQLADDFCAFKIYEDSNLLPKIMDVIFEKAVEEPHFCPLYSDLCIRQVNKELEECQGKKFRTALIQTCQNSFYLSNEVDKKVDNLRKKLLEAKKEGTSDQTILKDELDQLIAKERRRLHGIIQLIACLYHQRQLNLMVVLGCTKILAKKASDNADELYVEYMIGLLEKVGERCEQDIRRLEKEAEKKKSFADRTKLGSKPNKEEIAEKANWEKIFKFLEEQKSKLTKRIQFMIMNLEDLREKNWAPRGGGDKGPKTIEEIRDQAKREQDQQEAERAAYEQKKEEERAQRQHERQLQYQGSFRTGRGNQQEKGRGDSRRPPYPGRHSYDKRATTSYSNTGQPQPYFYNQQQKHAENRFKTTPLQGLDDATNMKRSPWQHNMQNAQSQADKASAWRADGKITPAARTSDQKQTSARTNEAQSISTQPKDNKPVRVLQRPKTSEGDTADGEKPTSTDSNQ